VSLEKIKNKYIHKLIFYYQQLELYFERYLILNEINLQDLSQKEELKPFKSFQIRGAY
jgi:hypothetical protein